MPQLAPATLLQREAALQAWFVRQLPDLHRGTQLGSLEVVSGDASFRRYFRAQTQAGPLILVDAPPEHEDCAPFLKVDQLMAAGGVRVPAVLAADLEQGYMCLEDFGNTLLWTQLKAAQQHDPHQSGHPRASALYQQAFAQLLLIQQQALATGLLAEYDDALLQREMDLFVPWFLEGLLNLEVTAEGQQLVAELALQLRRRARAQTQVLVHRDYHSRNLMVMDKAQLGVIDFQDAVSGPLTYDLVSLLRDCYISWPQQQVHDWVLAYREQALHAGIAVPEPEVFVQDFDFMGLQRHLKVLGIFSRLWLRDTKAGYLNDIPLTYSYLTQVLARYECFAPFSKWLAEHVSPLLPAALAQIKAGTRP